MQLPATRPADAGSRPLETARDRSARWLALLPVALAAVAHAPALWSGLVWDDRIILRDQLVRFESLSDVIMPPAGIPNWADNYYRPLVLLSYLLDFRLPGDSPTVTLAHLSNLLFHVVTTWLVWRLVRRLVGPAGGWAALGAAALFAVHPVHVESVNWISARTDVLSTLFFVAAVLAALQYRDCRATSALVSTGLCLLLALLAKEVALAGLGVIPLLWSLAPRSAAAGVLPLDARFWRRGLAALLLPATLYLLGRSLAGTTLGVPLELGPLVLTIGLARALAWYLLKLVVPWPLNNLVTWDLLPGLLLSAVVALSAVAGLFGAWRHWRRRGDGLPLAALGWLLLTLVPSLWVAVSFGTRAPVAERYLYLPSVGAALGAGWLLAAARGRWALGVTAAGVAAFAVGCFAWGLVWSSEVRLWSATTARAPGNVFAWHSLARAWREAGDFGKAREAYQHGLEAEQDPFERSKVLYGLAELSLAEGDLEAARAFMERSRRENPDFRRAGYGIGLIGLLQAGDSVSPAARAQRQAAIREFRDALRVLPDFHEARVALAQGLAAEGAAAQTEGRVADAARAYAEALRQLDELQTLLPPRQLEAYLREAEPGLERDIPALRARLTRAARP